MEKQASRNRVSLMSGCFVENASVVLYEGSRHENDHVSLTPYDGPCHQTHDNLARHVALVTNPTFNEYALRRFTEKFFQQLKVCQPVTIPCFHRALFSSRYIILHIDEKLTEDLFIGNIITCWNHHPLSSIGSASVYRAEGRWVKPRPAQHSKNSLSNWGEKAVFVNTSANS